jgi:hypothetical protein
MSEEDCDAYLTAQFDGFFDDSDLEVLLDTCYFEFTDDGKIKRKYRFFNSSEEIREAQRYSSFLQDKKSLEKKKDTTIQEVKVEVNEKNDYDFISDISSSDRATISPYWTFLDEKGATKDTFRGRKNYPLRYHIINEAITPATREYIEKNKNKMVAVRELLSNFSLQNYPNTYYVGNEYFYLNINEIKKMLLTYITSTRDCPEGFTYILRLGKDKINELFNMPFQVERKDRGKRRKKTDEILSDRARMSDAEMRKKHGKNWKRKLEGAQKRAQ